MYDHHAMRSHIPGTYCFWLQTIAEGQDAVPARCSSTAKSASSPQHQCYHSNMKLLPDRNMHCGFSAKVGVTML